MASLSSAHVMELDGRNVKLGSQEKRNRFSVTRLPSKNDYVVCLLLLLSSIEFISVREVLTEAEIIALCILVEADGSRNRLLLR